MREPAPETQGSLEVAGAPGNSAESQAAPTAQTERRSDPAAPADLRWRPLVTMRVGIAFLAISGCLLIAALIATKHPQDHQLHSLLWVGGIAACSLAGLVSMRSVQTLRTIEAELTRAARDPRSWRAARPLLGRDPATEGWNRVLQEIARAERPATPARNTAGLEREAVTLARAMRGLPAAWVITDSDGSIRFLSPAACGLFALDEETDHAGRDLLELLGLRPRGAADDSGAAADDSSATADDSSGATRAAPHDPDQERQRSEQLAELLGPVRMVGARLAVTITSRTLEIRIARSRLEGRSGDAEGFAWVLSDITQQQLATDARDQFLMTATHELRTPLSNLHAYAEALQDADELDVESQKEFCNVITSEAVRLGRLVDHLLTVSQMEAGSMVANRHELEMLPILEEAAEQVRTQAEQKQIQLTTDLSAKLPTVFGDREKLHAAVVNLVGNAVKYTPENGQVTVRCMAEDRWIRIEVEDNGIGIPEDEQARVFEKFYRCASAAQAGERGNGLGLAFSHEVVRLHGGEIQLISRVEEGSTFTMRLPIGGQSRSGV